MYSVQKEKDERIKILTNDPLKDLRCPPIMFAKISKCFVVLYYSTKNQARVEIPATNAKSGCQHLSKRDEIFWSIKTDKIRNWSTRAHWKKKCGVIYYMLLTLRSICPSSDSTFLFSEKCGIKGRNSHRRIVRIRQKGQKKMNKINIEGSTFMFSSAVTCQFWHKIRKYESNRKFSVKIYSRPS